MGEDYRFPSGQPGVDTRFPGPGTDEQFPVPGLDTRFDPLGWDARFMGATAQPWKATAVQFNGSTRMQAGGSIPDVPVGSSALFAFWIRMGGLLDTAPQTLFCNWEGTVQIYRAPSTNRLRLSVGRDTESYVKSSNAANFIVANQAWRSVLFAVDTNHPAGQKLSQLYIDDVLDPGYGIEDTAPAFTIQWDALDWLFASTFDGGQLWSGAVADFRVYPNVYPDLSITANRRFFVTAGNTPAEGIEDTGSEMYGRPLLALANPLATWNTNRGGYGGAIPVYNGPLEAADIGPSG